MSARREEKKISSTHEEQRTSGAWDSPPLTDALQTRGLRTGQQRTFVETVEEGGVTGSGDLATFCLPLQQEKDRLF